ncbi:cation-translocating P-type ATPase [Brevibacillus formosus]|uniref:Cd(2+)-exporting ATPase n=1 Tax=Brevibacillus formosus TaxID=54913 RepID=A0A837KE04_9BACL|nr:cation-translocating P-type ATPase [Brevibacillus formosus]KLH96020.1 ATPase [Brevibacillus formosus]MED1958520.1 cation-translocating P-type ATPase [Brevibacillus formosus]PSJ93143.1 heavy metal translocating P-type ATPase [Brevibacillus formosus]GED61042.1 copper-translocating P-type ATPase [Brevibacillus formosus]
MAEERKKEECCSGHQCGSEHKHAGKILTVLEPAAAATESAGILSSQAVVYRVTGMDCSSCAKSLEKHMQTLPAVKEVNVNFSTGKMQLVADGLGEDAVVKEVAKAGYSAMLLTRRTAKAVPKTDQAGTVLTTISGVLLALGFLGSLSPSISPLVVTVLYALSIISGGYRPARSAFYAIKSGSLDMNVLMSVAAVGAALIGEWLEGATVVWLFSIGNLLQTKSIEKTRDSIRNLMDLAPPEAWVKVGESLTRKPVEDIAVGQVIVVKPGEKIPLDGVIVHGTSSVNQAPITGESIPVDKLVGDSVFAGSVNESGAVEIKVTKLVEDTAIARIIHLVEEAQEKKAPTQAFVDKFAAIYTPIVLVLALLVIVFPPLLGLGTWGEWFYRGLELLVVACPCALVISTPVAIVSAIGNAARNGVLIKGGTFLEKAGAITAIAFDKTGTLTEGKPQVAAVIELEGSEDEVVSIARTIEERSSHPIAQAILTYANQKQVASQSGQDFKAIIGKGASAVIGTETFYAGKPALFQELGIDFSAWQTKIESLQSEGHTLVVIGTATKLIGMIAVADTIREITVSAIGKLKAAGIEDIVMLTGDNTGTAKKVASQTGVNRYFAELLPQDKVEAVKKLQQEGKVVAMVGDGINDAPALASADLGIAMGGAGTDTAMETADIVLMADNLEKLPHTMKVSRKALTIIKQNIWFSIIVKLIALVLIFPGYLTLWLAVLSDTGAALLVILNSMRLLRMKD